MSDKKGEFANRVLSADQAQREQMLDRWRTLMGDRDQTKDDLVVWVIAMLVPIMLIAFMIWQSQQ